MALLQHSSSMHSRTLWEPQGTKMDSSRSGPLGQSVPGSKLSGGKHRSFYVLWVSQCPMTPLAEGPCRGHSVTHRSCPARSPSAGTPCVPSSCSGIWPQRLCSSPDVFSFALLPRLAVRAQSHRLDTTGSPEHSFPAGTRTDRGTDPPCSPASQQAAVAAEAELSPGHRRILLGAGRSPRPVP